ncbi:hypothetical protein C8F01DRAFT_1372935 [Mycena amicta]|nr:hypothetical protein C8F01DRAFT_1372935 [Mycena amicta]
MSTESSSLTHLLDTNDPPLEPRHVLDAIQSLEASMEAALTQLSDSRATTARLEEQIGNLGETLRKYRAIFAPVRRVPPELVSHILRYALPDDYVSGSSECVPWNLGHICRSWRVTALADSFLWSFIPVGRSNSKPWAQLVPPLKSQLSRTNDVLLSVFFISGGPFITQEVLSILSPTAPRWRHIRFYGMMDEDDELSWVTQLQGRLPALERLEFHGTCIPKIANVFSQNVPCLRIVELLHPIYPDFSPDVDLPFSQLTHYLAANRYKFHATNLSGAPNLEVCVLRTTAEEPSERLPFLPTSHLPRLRALHVGSLNFLRYITAPVLKHLAVFPNTDDVSQILEVLPFLQQSGCAGTLRRLALMQCEITGSDILEVLRILSSLEALVLEFAFTDSDPSTILAALTIGDDEHIICPKLASLTYGNLNVGKSLECVNMLPTLARSRAQFLSRQSRRFELYIYENCLAGLVVLPKDMFKFERLADDGVDLLFMSSTDPRVVKEQWGDF